MSIAHRRLEVPPTLASTSCGKTLLPRSTLALAPTPLRLGRSAQRRTNKLAVSARHHQDPWETLGVPADACDKQVKKAYRKLALRHHPDVSSLPDAEVRFLAIQEAYEIISGKRRGKEASAHGSGDWDFHDWYWSFRAERTWSARNRSRGPATSGGNGSSSRESSRSPSREPPPRAPPPSGVWRSQMGGLKQRAAQRANKRRHQPHPAAAAPPPQQQQPAQAPPEQPSRQQRARAAVVTPASPPPHASPQQQPQQHRDQRAAKSAKQTAAAASFGTSPKGRRQRQQRKAGAASAPSSSGSSARWASAVVPFRRWVSVRLHAHHTALARLREHRPSAPPTPASPLPTANADGWRGGGQQQQQSLLEVMHGLRGLNLAPGMGLGLGSLGMMTGQPGAAGSRPWEAARASSRPPGLEHIPAAVWSGLGRRSAPAKQQQQQAAATSATTTAATAVASTVTGPAKSLSHELHHHHHTVSCAAATTRYHVVSIAPNDAAASVVPTGAAPSAGGDGREEEGGQGPSSGPGRRGFHADDVVRDRVSSQLAGLKRKAAMKRRRAAAGGDAPR